MPNGGEEYGPTKKERDEKARYRELQFRTVPYEPLSPAEQEELARLRAKGHGPSGDTT